MTWEVFLRHVLLGLALFAGGTYAFIAIMNPYGNLPLNILGSHIIMDSNQRYQYPAIIRSGAFNSFVLGTSTSRLLDPTDLDTSLGGKFANLSMDDGRAWEQFQLAELILAAASRPSTVVIGVDAVWCMPDADTARTTGRGFPMWLYDKSEANDWLHLFNATALEIAVRKLGYYLGFNEPEWTASGFNVFVPPEADYDLKRAQSHIWGNAPHGIAAASTIYSPTAEERGSWQFPALAWLASLLDAADRTTRFVFVMMPVHISAQPQPGSLAAAREAECKDRITRIAGRRGAEVVDMRIASPLTALDANYWDPLHYRLPVGQRIIANLKRALATRANDPGGEWVYRSGP